MSHQENPKVGDLRKRFEYAKTQVLSPGFAEELEPIPLTLFREPNETRTWYAVAVPLWRPGDEPLENVVWGTRCLDSALHIQRPKEKFALLGRGIFVVRELLPVTVEEIPLLIEFRELVSIDPVAGTSGLMSYCVNHRPGLSDFMSPPFIIVNKGDQSTRLMRKGEKWQKFDPDGLLSELPLDEIEQYYIQALAEPVLASLEGWRVDDDSIPELLYRSTECADF